MTVMTNPRSKKPPLWVYGGPKPAPDDFKASPRCNCRDRWHYFFSDDLQDQETAKNLCATCPMLHPCTRWTLENYEILPVGIFAGMDEDWRRRIYYGHETYWDWAREWKHSRRAARAAAYKRERQGIRKRDQRLTELPPCPDCDRADNVVREGRNKSVGRQKYRCTACERYFLGEEL